MSELFHTLFSFPTVIFTSLLGLCLLYWLTVILGLLDLDLFDVDLDLDLDPGVDAALDGADAGDLELGEGTSGGLVGVVQSLGLAGVPLTISVSLVVLIAWLVSYFATRATAGLTAGGGVPATLVHAGVALGALIAGLLVARFAILPLRPVFATQRAARRQDFVGSLCTVATNRVSDSFGQAEIADGGSGLLVQVRCRDANQLRRGDPALVYEYDADDEVYYVAPADPALVRR